jgi:diguanylate cyclase (GGDEF)-like protein
VLNFLKRSLRAKFTLVLFIVGLIPLGATSIFFYYTAKDSLFKNVFKELKWSLEDVSGLVEEYFEQSQKDLLIASRNTAFTMYFSDQGGRAHWVREQQRSLRYLRTMYPDMLDEACFIEAGGKEVSRIVFDEVSHEHDLSSDEGRSEFFIKAFLVNEGEVFQGKPVLSEDTHRWVLPNATPITVKGRKAAILHFEVTLTYFQRLLKKHINPDRGAAFILDGDGRFIAHTALDISETEPHPEAAALSSSEALKGVYARMMKGESGMESFSDGGVDYYIIFKPIEVTYQKGMNENRWSLGYLIPSDRIYVELDILKYNMAAMGLTAMLVMLLAYVTGNYVTKPIRSLASATNRVSAGEMPIVSVDREDELGTLSKSFNTMVESIRRRDEALRDMATSDGLTGLFNFRHFRGELEKAVKSAARFGRPVSLIMADVDWFKHYNDTNGHAAGDQCLKKVAEVFMKNAREVDISARYGGEEFAVILPETSKDGALKLAERLRAKLEEETVPFEALQPNGAVTMSLGVASYPDDAQDPQSLVEAADKALYKAKEKGRNTVWPPVSGG